MSNACLIRQWYYPIDQRVRNQVEALAMDGYHVDVICLKRPEQRMFERCGRITIWRLPLPQRRAGKIRYVWQYSVFFILAALLATALHLRRRFQLISAHSLPDILVFATAIPKLLGARVVLDLHECMPEFFATKFGVAMRHPAVRVISWMEQASIRFAHFTTTCNKPMRQRFVDRGADPKRIDIVLHSADEAVFNVAQFPPSPRKPGRFTLICHGTMDERYGLDTAIRAVSLLNDKIPELRLELYGEGPQKADLQALARRLGVTSRVWFSDGLVPVADLLAAIARADAGLVATKRDEFRDLTHCLKMFEFVSMMRPVICSRTPAVEAYFDEDSFLYFSSGDHEDLARAIEHLYAEPEIGSRMVSRATAVNRGYCWALQRELYLSMMRRVVEVSHGPVSSANF